MKRCLLGLVCLFVSIYSFGQTLEADRLALVAIYNKANGPGWGVNWAVPGNVGDSPCGWDGVTCAGGRVTRLTLSPPSSGASLPAEIGNLSELIYLDLWTEDMGPGFMGIIPSELGNLSKLEYLRLDGNYFDLQDVSFLGNLANLKQLSMNPLGNIPASFANLVNLERCNISPYGTFPVGTTVMEFPEAICQLPKIKYLRIAGVSFTTPLSGQIGNLTTLDTLELTGAPPFGSGSVATIWGNIPAEMGNLTNLRYLNLSFNGLTGSVPASFNNLTNLTKLDLSHNLLTGPIPNILGIPVAASVDISNNLFNLAGMISNRTVLDVYAPQGLISMTESRGMLESTIKAEDGVVYDANNSYTYFKDKSEVPSQGTYNSYVVFTSQKGRYRIEVRNSLLPALVLSTAEMLIEPPLPVTLISFNGKSENNQIKLTWKTTSETNNKGFEIERSADARTFEKIGFVDGNGDSKEINTYHFTDLNPLAKGYYRLKQLDYDGQFEYSKVISVKSDAAIVKVYPNPAQEYLTISGIAQKQPFSIIDQNGRVVLEGLVADKGQINVKNLAPGRYVVSVNGESRRLLIHR
ncbi:leucine-rich repeat domain-containing protein [Dyadobacter jiangsuensis]